MTELILASQSPRRQALIRLLNQPVRVQVADVDEESVHHPDPAIDVVQTATLKATTIGKQVDDAIIIAADTAVVVDGLMLGKPADAAEARAMLMRLRGRKHQVHTGIALLHMSSGRLVTAVSTTDVTMRPYSDEEVAKYVATGDPMDKAGAYAIQHDAFHPVARLRGCYTGVVGLPLCHLLNALRQFDITINLPVARKSQDYRRCQTCMSMMEDGKLDAL